MPEPLEFSPAPESNEPLDALALPSAGTMLSPEDERQFSDAVLILRGPEQPPKRGGLWLVLSLIAFVVSGRGKQAPMEAALVAGVIFFHELGHWLGMRLFGYRDLKIFFIPFFGGAASGKKEGVPQWQQAIVVLLGPLPGIIVGFACVVANQDFQQPLLAQLAWWLMVINGFNLLPLVPLDGGRFLNIVIFSRQRVLETLFLAVTSVGIIALSVWLQAYLLAALGVFGLLMVPARFRIAGVAAGVRGRWPVLPSRIADADDSMLLDLYQHCSPLLTGKFKTQAASRANLMRQVYEQANVRPVGVLASLGLLAVYALGIALCFLAVLWVVVAAAIARRAGN